MFKIMDTDQDGFINFKDLLLLLNMICGADIQKRLKLLFCIHLPRAVIPGELETLQEDNKEISADALVDYGEMGNLNSIKGWLIREDSEIEMSKFPPMPQQYFVLLWKSLYALFKMNSLSPETEEQQV